MSFFVSGSRRNFFREIEHWCLKKFWYQFQESEEIFVKLITNLWKSFVSIIKRSTVVPGLMWLWFFWKITLGENHVVRSWWELLSKIFSVSKNFHNMILLCTKITLWEFFKTKMKHHVMRNHVMGNHVRWGTAVFEIGQVQFQCPFMILSDA